MLMIGSDIPNNIQTIPPGEEYRPGTCGFAGPKASPHPPIANTISSRVKTPIATVPRQDRLAASGTAATRIIHGTWRVWPLVDETGDL